MNQVVNNQVLVGKEAPDFCMPAVLANGDIQEYRLSDHVKGKYGLVFFYPLDFTFVCPSELIALDHRMPLLHELNVEVVAVSIDSQFTHAAWRKTPVKAGGIGPVTYTLIADLKHEIAQAYGVEHPDAGVALRGAFIIDKQGIIRAQLVNDLPLGRNIDELIRLVKALQFTEKHGEVCPAGWQEGDSGMQPTTEGVASYLGKHSEEL